MTTKPTQATDVLPEFIVCPDCGHDVFQWHERGTMTRFPDNTLHIEYTELAGACQSCHHVLTLPIRGVIDYQA